MPRIGCVLGGNQRKSSFRITVTISLHRGLSAKLSAYPQVLPTLPPFTAASVVSLRPPTRPDRPDRPTTRSGLATRNLLPRPRSSLAHAGGDAIAPLPQTHSNSKLLMAPVDGAARRAPDARRHGGAGHLRLRGTTPEVGEGEEVRRNRFPLAPVSAVEPTRAPR